MTLPTCYLAIPPSAFPDVARGLAAHDLPCPAGQTFLEFGPKDVNLTRNETGAVTVEIDEAGKLDVQIFLGSRPRSLSYPE